MPISTHAPRTGSDPMMTQCTGAKRNFNPRSPHGERPIRHLQIYQSQSFQPTLPARGATVLWQDCRIISPISTHAPRTGSDSRRATD